MINLHFISTLFFTFVFLLSTEANAKGGGGKGHSSSSGKTTKGSTISGGSSSSKGSSSGDGSSSSTGGSTSKSITSGSGSHIIYIGGGTNQASYCKDSITNETVPCPTNSSNHKRDVIIAAVLSSVFGAILLSLAVMFLSKQRNRRRRAHKTTAVPSATSQSTKGVYQKLEEPREDYAPV